MSQLHEIVGNAAKECLARGVDVELDGLGVFRRVGTGVTFVPTSGPRIFIAYVVEDYQHAARLYSTLAAAGFNPWLDRKKLLAGQDWGRCIERAIDTCDFFIPCFSPRSVRKRGQFPYEIRYALRTADRMPLDDIFVLPVRFGACEVPRRIAWQTQYEDLLPDWEDGSARLIESIRYEWEKRKARTSD
ncbi:MAG TPA: toll/interleukin-1 receptor domain-containing protein [Bryobacteraceae bacterium]|nr:toll/interleukin-1 receptor domain-containing protein [Bryobacteraceae bacterium]